MSNPAPARVSGPDLPAIPRLVSLDALRGFDMFWILGMEAVGAALANASQAPWTQLIAHQLDHAEWTGFRFLDLIFPSLFSSPACRWFIPRIKTCPSPAGAAP